MVVNALDEFIVQIINKIALDIVANLTAAPGQGGTPVDTGWARANWIPRIGAPFSGVAGSRENVSAGDQGAGVASIIANRTNTNVFISNNVPYILRLNEGSSQQAPRGFVQAAIKKAIGGVL